MNDFPLRAGIEVLNPVLTDSDPSKQIIAAKCLGLMNGYDARWREAPYKIDGVEAFLTSDLYNPETNRKSRSFISAGKLDLRVTDVRDGRKLVVDHKSTSMDISDPAGAYWSQLVVEGQVSHYMLLEWLNGNKVDGALWDVMKKPGISPKAVAKADAKVVRENGVYFDYKLNESDIEAFEKDQRETPMMYAARLAHDCTIERPEHYFQRRPVQRLQAEILEYASEQWSHGQDILHEIDKHKKECGGDRTILPKRSWQRNSGACYNYSSPCKYLGLCSGHDSLETGNWTKKEWVHNELPVLNDGRGTEVLTNSRIRCFQTCKRKHFYAYELGVDKVDEEEKEALYFGTLWHSASEAYFTEMKKQQENA